MAPKEKYHGLKQRHLPCATWLSVEHLFRFVLLHFPFQPSLHNTHLLERCPNAFLLLRYFPGHIPCLAQACLPQTALQFCAVHLSFVHQIGVQGQGSAPQSGVLLFSEICVDLLILSQPNAILPAKFFHAEAFLRNNLFAHNKISEVC